jgi:cellulose biosynthesis protein BcsQ
VPPGSVKAFTVGPNTAAFAEAGKRVLLVDADPQGSALAWSAAAKRGWAQDHNRRGSNKRRPPLLGLRARRFSTRCCNRCDRAVSA